MLEKRHYGVPRSHIGWGPTINYNRCISCGKCVDYCTLGVYKFVEKEGKKRIAVENYNNCVVFCRLSRAMSCWRYFSPLKKENREANKKWRKPRT